MPILKPEADFYPQDLFELPSDEFPWWVAHVRSRQEKVVAREAIYRNVPFYLPQREQPSEGARRRISYIPLFQGYLFFRGGADARLEVLKTNQCVRILDVTDQSGIQEDLQQIKRLQESQLMLVPHPELAEGDPVKITEGPFKGYVGILEARKGRIRLIVAVRFIHRFVSVEVAADMAQPLKDEYLAQQLLEKRVA